MLRRLLNAWLLALLALAAWPLPAQQLLPVPPLSGRVVDQTGTLSAAQRQALSAKLEAVERKHGSQLVVLMVASTVPEDIADYTQRVGDQWKIGRADVGDGALIVVAKNDRKVRIAVAKALEGAIPDLAARQIITERITPAFRAGDFAGGLNAAVDRMAERIGTEGLPEPPAWDRGHVGDADDLQWQDLGIFLLVGAPILGAVFSAMFGRKLGALFTGGAVGGLGWVFTASVLLAVGAGLLAMLLVGVIGIGAAGRRGGGGGLGGLGGGPIIWGGGGGGRSGGGGGFSSGGGGDFGGGGASGGW